MKKLLKFLIFPFVFIGGIISFLITKKTFNLAYVSFRYYFVLTNGKSNNIANKIIEFFVSKYDINEANGVLGNLNKSDLNTIVSDINKNGFHVFDIKLNESRIDEIYKFASSTKVSYLEYDKKSITYSKNKILFKDNKEISTRFQFETQQLFDCKSCVDLAFDKSLLAVANSYLNTKPILDLVSMWWSVPFDKEAKNKAAQMYHFDMDKFKFIKFFFYLTDVSPNNGPHCLVRNSHKELPKSLLEDRRFTDLEISKNYSKQDILELTGQKGSIIAVDTRCLHKGKALIEGERLLFQIQFSNSLFGAPFNELKNVKLTDSQKSIKEEYKRTYSLVNE